MKLFALGVIALMDAALPAAAADRMPAKLVGNWCMDRTINAKMTVGLLPALLHARIASGSGFAPMGYWKAKTAPMARARHASCSKVVVIKPDDYLAKFRCNTEGQPSNTVYRLSLDRDRLVMTILD